MATIDELHAAAEALRPEAERTAAHRADHAAQHIAMMAAGTEPSPEFYRDGLTRRDAAKTAGLPYMAAVKAHQDALQGTVHSLEDGTDRAALTERAWRVARKAARLRERDERRAIATAP